LIVVTLKLMGCSGESVTTPNAFIDSENDVVAWDFGDISTTEHAFQGVSVGDDEQYSIAVATFTGTGHEENARKTLAGLVVQYPSIGRNITVRKRSRGSALTYGKYSGYEDPNAKSDLMMLRSIATPQGRSLFNQLLLTKFRSVQPKQSLHPHDLWTIRREYPTIVPIYTLEVAVWGDFDSGQLPRAKRRMSAEQYASELRAKGYEAFYYHNDDSELSSVTVGLFSYKAIDAETGFYSPEVEAMLARFPQRLMNGQPVLEYNDPSNHSKGTKVQAPCLAEVPVD
jgi:hypothetical protein